MAIDSYTLRAFWWLMLCPALTAVLYFFCCSGTRGRRIGVAAHSVALLAAFLYAVVASPWSSHDPSVFLWPFWCLLSVYVVGIVYAVVQFKGEEAIHGLQIFQALNAFIIWAIGTIAITHDGP